MYCTILYSILWASPNGLANLFRVKIVVHKLVDDVVRVFIYKLKTHGFKVGSDIVADLG